MSAVGSSVLAGFRPFSIESLRVAADMPYICGADQLIRAVAIRHWGADAVGTVMGSNYVASRGALGLAQWLVDHAGRLNGPVGGNSLLQRGDMIERMLIGMLVPSEEVLQEVAALTDGKVLPDHWDDFYGCAVEPALQGQTASTTPAQVLDCGEDAQPASATDLPPIGVIGGAVPPGRLFHPIADARLSNGFVLTGCGLMVGLDESTALAMRAAIDAGIAHLRDVRAASAQKARAA